MTLLDTCYLSGGLDADGPMPLQAEQRRFSDGHPADLAHRADGAKRLLPQVQRAPADDIRVESHDVVRVRRRGASRGNAL